MKTFRRLTLVLAAAAALAAARPAAADEEKVPLDKVPRAVLDAVKDKYPDAELVGAERETEKGKTHYEIALKHKGSKLEVILTPEGKVVAVEKTIPAAALPRAVAEALKTKFPGTEIKGAEEITRDGKVTYEVQLKDGDRKREVVFDPSGKVVEEEDKSKDRD